MYSAVVHGGGRTTYLCVSCTATDHPCGNSTRFRFATGGISSVISRHGKNVTINSANALGLKKVGFLFGHSATQIMQAQFQNPKTLASGGSMYFITQGLNDPF
eukprot:8296843-Pyramimonas_sp.AAC.1